MKLSKRTILVGLVVALALLVAACAQPAAPAPTEPPAEEPTGPVSITFWHAMSGSRQDVVNDLVSTFNEKNPDIQVSAEYTGSYAETLTKALAAVRAGAPPTIVQVYEVGTQTMLDSDAIVPVYTLAPGDFNWDEVVQPVMKYYSVQGKMYCMPFNSSTAMLYYNKDVFRAAGLDPDKPPTTFDEVFEYGKQIIDSGAAKGGISFGWPAWIFEQMHAYHSQLYANNDNGRAGMATEVLFNQDFGVKVLTEWQKWAEEGVLIYGGRTYKANDPFLAGEFAMLAQSTSSLAGILKKADFEVGTTFLPRMAGDYPKGNSVIGGGCLWVLKGHTPEEEAAAWKFLQYSFSPERAKIWHKGTGYFPISNTAYEELKQEGWFEEEPNHATAFNQILGGADTPAARGVLLGNFVQIRDITGTAIEEVLVNGKDPKATLDEAAAETNRVLAEYQQTLK
ncbi:MAG: ABC transporter substrate-binding protein [Anaerolineae bacterium]